MAASSEKLDEIKSALQQYFSKDFDCPITWCRIDKPVILMYKDGSVSKQIFEKASIREWLNQSNQICPLTRKTVLRIDWCKAGVNIIKTIKEVLPIFLKDTIEIEKSKYIIELIEELSCENDEINNFLFAKIYPLACNSNRKKIVVFLLENGADVNQIFEGGDDKGFTPLHIAVFHGHGILTKILIDHGANIDYILEKGGWKGSSPLYLAAYREHYNLVHLLLAHGVKLSKEDKTKLNYSCIKPEIRKIILLSVSLMRLSEGVIFKKRDGKPSASILTKRKRHTP